MTRTLYLIALCVSLAFSTACWQSCNEDALANLERARAETAALEADLVALARNAGDKSISQCGLHEPVYGVVQEQEQARALRQGSFAAMVAQGMPESRAELFLDPWNSPYWIRDHCDATEERRVIFIYSFGPNRSRDSSPWAVEDDDVGRYLRIER